MNYAISSAVLLGIGVSLVGWGYVAPGIASLVGVVLCIPLSMWLWRYARNLWLGFSYLIDHNVRAGSRFAPIETESLKRQQNSHPADRWAFHCVCPYCIAITAHRLLNPGQRLGMLVWPAMNRCS